MKALILAAGRGQRMNPLTQTTPKPLLCVQGKALIEWHIEALARAGVQDIVINTAWLEAQFPALLGDGHRWQVRLHYSMEGRDHGGALETAGGMAKALPLLGTDHDTPFWVVSGDIFAPEFTFSADIFERFTHSAYAAHLWLVPNPPFHAKGDFALTLQGLATRPTAQTPTTYTYANIALVRPSLVAHVPIGTIAPLGPILHQAADAQRLSAEQWHGRWENVGTPAQLNALNAAAKCCDRG
jgi:MurNAc alpha-1-phosphate uridylyltransferase